MSMQHPTWADTLTAVTQPGAMKLNIPLAGSALECRRAVRVVPGKRVVCQGVWQQQAVYAKLFIGPDAARYAARDRDGVAMLQQAGIATPPLLFAGQADGASAQVLLFAEVLHSQNAEQLWDAQPLLSPARKALAMRVVSEVALHHTAGLMQTDLYLKNFLLADDKLYTLDGDGMRRLSAWRSDAQAMHNLAVLLSKLDVLELETWLADLVQAYRQLRPQAKLPSLSELQKRAIALRRRMLVQYADHKVLRECTDVHVIHTAQAYAAYSRAHVTAALVSSMQNPDLLLQEDQQQLKRGNTCSVAKFALDGEEMVVKRYNIKSFWHGLGRAWRQSRAAVSWRNAHRLQLAGIATPQPLVLVEQRRLGMRGLAYFVAAFVNAPDAVTFFADNSMRPQDRKDAALHLARLFRRLYLLGISHGDCKASNILMQGLQPCLIDLDSMQQHRCLVWFERRHIRDLRRFMRNWQQDPETTALLSSAFASMAGYNPILARAGITISDKA